MSSSSSPISFASPLPSSSAAMVLSLNFVRSSFLFVLIAALITSHIEVSSAKSLGLAFQDDFWSQTPEYSKRNSWWSKKSLDSTPKYQQLLQESGPFTNAKLQEEQSPISDFNTGNIPILYDCYIQLCVPDFVSCTQRARTKKEYRQCKATHRLCALQCWVQSTEMTVTEI